MWLVRRGMRVHASRRLLFLMGALLAALCIAVPFLTEGWLVVGVLLPIGLGSLGMFPCYYSFSQDLTVRNQGKVTGTLGACCWCAMALWQIGIGHWVDYTKSYTLPFIISGLVPLIGFTVLLLFWGPTEEPVRLPAIAEERPRVADSEERIVGGEEVIAEAVGIRTPG
jgi:ACS family hexuronate transporter-like MFS transporter